MSTAPFPRQPAPPPTATPGESAGPASHGRRVVFLLDASSRIEKRILEDWVAANSPGAAGDGRSHAATPQETVLLPPSRRPRRRQKLDPRLETSLMADDDPLLAPLRVAWLAPGGRGDHPLRFRDLLRPGVPHDPGSVRQAWIRRLQPERCQVIAAEPASLSDLRKRWQAASGIDITQTTSLAEFVARQAALALERAERRVRGNRYKVPRFIHQEILRRPGFQAGLARLARELDKPEPALRKEAAGYLQEIAATHHPHVIDLTAHLIHLLYTQGYGEALHYDRARLDEICALTQRHPVVFLPTHKSNFDHLVLQYALYENGHPPNHTAGGINMNFFPVGPLVRRSGVFFIRRSFKDNPVYKFVLRQYIDFLIEKRFSLEWYIEGGRSRSGKLLPPMFGMLAYVVDAYRRGRAEDVFLVPVSIAYDQIQDVGDYVAEQRGAKKQRESFSWFVGFVRRLKARSGDIHIRFGDPVSLRQSLGPPDPGAEPDPDERNLGLQKVAFEVAARIDRVTPLTPTSILTMALLGVGDRALSLEEVCGSLRNLLHFVKLRELPTTSDVGRELGTPAGVERMLRALVESGLVSCFAAGPEPVYMLGENQHLTAAYYRNTIIHFFVSGAIAELALLRAAEEDVEDRRATFWEETARLRDLLKFEFFFSEKEQFRSDLAAELALHDPEWESALADGPLAIRAMLRRIRPFSAHRVLRPFLESYLVVADALLRSDVAAPGGTGFDEAGFLAGCVALGQQYSLQRRIRSPESVSKVSFQTALRLARNRGVVEPPAEFAAAPAATMTEEMRARRRRFADEIRAVVRRIDVIDLLAASRRAGIET